jgi:hypothetical protein
VADTINIIGVVVQRPARIMFEVIVISGLGQLAGRRNVVRHIVGPSLRFLICD